MPSVCGGWSSQLGQRSLAAAPQDEELLARAGVLGDEGGATAREVGERARHNILFGGFRRGEPALPERADKGLAEPGTTVEHARQHRALLSL